MVVQIHYRKVKGKKDRGEDSCLDLDEYLEIGHERIKSM